MKEYNIGEVAFWAHAGQTHIKEDCPICFGKRVVVLILGNGEQVQTDCDYCGKGWERARGYVQERYEWNANVQPVVIQKKDVYENQEERKIRYSFNDGYTAEPQDLFGTREQADARVKDLIAEHEIEQARQIAHRKENNAKSYAWHVGYHQREMRKAEKDLAYHQSKVIAMKLLAKPEKTKV